MCNQDDVKNLLDHYQQNKYVVNLDEFRDDVSRFVYVKRIIRRYKNSGECNIRLLINHMVILNNVFDSLVTDHLLTTSSDDIEEQIYALLKFFNRLPQEYNKFKIDTNLYQMLEKEINE